MLFSDDQVENLTFSFKNERFLLVIFFLLFSINVVAQRDTSSIPKTRNQIHVEILGNNFIRENVICPVSINYSRKTGPFILNVGIGNNVELYGHPADYFSGFSFSAGALYRMKYKRNGFWVSFSGTIASGKWLYADVSSLPYNTIYHDINYQFTPGLSYQWQNKDEKFFFRSTLGCKFYAEMLDKTSYPGGLESPFIWGGLNVGWGF